MVTAMDNWSSFDRDGSEGAGAAGVRGFPKPGISGFRRRGGRSGGDPEHGWGYLPITVRIEGNFIQTMKRPLLRKILRMISAIFPTGSARMGFMEDEILDV